MGFRLEAKAANNAKPANASCCELPANWKAYGRLVAPDPGKCLFGPHRININAPPGRIGRHGSRQGTTGAPGRRHPTACPCCSCHLPGLAGAMLRWGAGSREDSGAVATSVTPTGHDAWPTAEEEPGQCYQQPTSAIPHHVLHYQYTELPTELPNPNLTCQPLA